MNDKVNHFNHAANDWDTPEKIKLINSLAKKTKEKLNLSTKDLSILDFGCGTGLFGLEFADLAEQLLGVDTSQGMLDVFNEKTKTADHISSLNIDLTTQKIDSRFDLILSAMAFHHIESPEILLKNLITHLKEEGKIAIVDLVTEDGSFHPDPTAMGVKHFGFSETEISSWLTSGYKLDFEPINTIEKNNKSYQQFLAVIQLQA